MTCLTLKIYGQIVSKNHQDYESALLVMTFMQRLTLEIDYVTVFEKSPTWWLSLHLILITLTLLKR